MVKKALEYHFSTVKQFQAVLESMGYQCYERDNQLCIKRDGCVIERLNLSDIMLRRQFGTHISKGRIAYNDDFIDLQDYQTETLRTNDRKAWLKAHPLEAANHQQQTTKESNTIHIQKPSITKEGSRDQNREWEVGHKNNYDEVDDERQLKR